MTQITTGKYHCFGVAEAPRAPASLKTHNSHRNKPASGRSTTDQVTLLTVDIEAGFEHNQTVGVALCACWRSSLRPYCSLRYCLVTWSLPEASAHVGVALLYLTALTSGCIVDTLTL